MTTAIWSLKTLFAHYYIMEVIIIQLDHKFSAGRTVSYISSASCTVLDKYSAHGRHCVITGLVPTHNLGRFWSQLRHLTGL